IAPDCRGLARQNMDLIRDDAQLQVQGGRCGGSECCFARTHEREHGYAGAREGRQHQAASGRIDDRMALDHRACTPPSMTWRMRVSKKNPRALAPAARASIVSLVRRWAYLGATRCRGLEELAELRDDQVDREATIKDHGPQHRHIADPTQ